MTEEYPESIAPEAGQPKNNTTKIIIIVAVIIVACICLCLCVIFVLPLLLGPQVGNVFSEIIDEMMLTPIP